MKTIAKWAAVFFGILTALCFAATLFLAGTGVWAGALVYGPLTGLFLYLAISFSVEADGYEPSWS